MNILITGSNGFIGKNLKFFLKERNNIKIYSFLKKDEISKLDDYVSKVDFVFHLAGVNRSGDENEFKNGNEILTRKLCEAIKKTKKKIPIIFSSSTKAECETPYGISKRNAENILTSLYQNFNIPVQIFRLPNVFGKWSKPNYNSVVSTYCYNIIRDIPIHISNPKNMITLVHIDDVIKQFIEIIDSKKNLDSASIKYIHPSYEMTLGDLAKQLYSFKKFYTSGIIERVGTGLVRSLYSTYISYLPKENFSYFLEPKNDLRGRFVEILKTRDSGQFSYFTVLPKQTRGNHYHHSKTEKFLVVKGNAIFRFFNQNSLEEFELKVNGDKFQVVESIPGWAHNITNIGDDELLIMLWSNENFDPDNPDTFFYKL